MSSIIDRSVCIGGETVCISADGDEICPIIVIIVVGDMGEPITTPLLMSSGSVLTVIGGSGGGGGGGRPMYVIDVGDPTSSSSLSSSSGVSEGGTAVSTQKNSCSFTSIMWGSRPLRSTMSECLSIISRITFTYVQCRCRAACHWDAVGTPRRVKAWEVVLVVGEVVMVEETGD